jgi:hypothetical protein
MNGATNGGQNIESNAEFMDGNFDGKEEMIVTLQQVKWEPNPLINLRIQILRIQVVLLSKL